MSTDPKNRREKRRLQASFIVPRSWKFYVTITGSILVFMLAWEPPLIGPLAGLDFHWTEEVPEDRPETDLNAWPTDPDDKLLQATVHSLTVVPGPESLAWDNNGSGPYTGVADGRILRWRGPEAGWETFGFSSTARTNACSIQPPSVANEHICGRPLGLKFDKKGNLYIADAYFGLVVLGPEGGVAQPVSTQAGGVPFKFTNDLDIDENGTVYFTDSSARRPRRQCNLVTFEHEKTGRILKYDPSTQQTTVVEQEVHYPNGITLAKDNSFFLVSLTSESRIKRYWLKGPKSGTVEKFADVPGYPDNIRTTAKGDFWVALHSRHTHLQYFMIHHRMLLRIMFSLPMKLSYLMSIMGGPPNAMVVKYNPEGEAIDALEDRSGNNTRFLSSVEERDGVLWLSSVYVPQIWTLRLNETSPSVQRE